MPMHSHTHTPNKYKLYTYISHTPKYMHQIHTHPACTHLHTEAALCPGSRDSHSPVAFLGMASLSPLRALPGPVNCKSTSQWGIEDPEAAVGFPAGPVPWVASEPSVGVGSAPRKSPALVFRTQHCSTPGRGGREQLQRLRSLYPPSPEPPIQGRFLICL